eukprot:103033_1
MADKSHTKSAKHVLSLTDTSDDTQEISKAIKTSKDPQNSSQTMQKNQQNNPETIKIIKLMEIRNICKWNNNLFEMQREEHPTINLKVYVGYHGDMPMMQAHK